MSYLLVYHLLVIWQLHIFLDLFFFLKSFKSFYINRYRSTCNACCGHHQRPCPTQSTWSEAQSRILLVVGPCWNAFPLKNLFISFDLYMNVFHLIIYALLAISVLP